VIEKSSTGAATDLTFLSLRTWLGYRSFVVFAAVSGAGGMYVWRMLPETRGATLSEVQRLLESKVSGMISAEGRTLLMIFVVPRLDNVLTWRANTALP